MIELQFPGELQAGESAGAVDSQRRATVAWVDSVQVFLGSEVLQLQTRGLYTPRSGEEPHYVVEVIGLPVVTGAQRLVVLSVTVLVPRPNNEWRYVAGSIGYYSGGAREAVPRILEAMVPVVEADLGRGAEAQSGL